MIASPGGRSDTAGPKVVGFVGFNGVTTLDLTGPLEAFAAAQSRELEHACYETLLVSVASKAFVASSGARLTSQHTLRTVPPLDTVIIPGGSALRDSQTSREIVAWLLGAGRKTRRI